MVPPRRLRSAAVLLAAVVAVLVATASPGWAITNGAPDGNGHPAVGGLVADHQYSDGTWIYCSGTLVAPKVFVTAAHCAEGDRVRVTFDTAYVDGDKTYAGTFHADPAYTKSTSDYHDIAVVVLDQAVRGITPARLPAAGSLAATTITGDSVCRSTNVDYRLDTGSARTFLSHYVTLP